MQKVEDPKEFCYLDDFRLFYIYFVEVNWLFKWFRAQKSFIERKNV